MRRSKNSKPNQSQRSISSFFVPTSNGGNEKSASVSHLPSPRSTFSAGIHSKPRVSAGDLVSVCKGDCSPSRKRKREISQIDCTEIIPSSSTTTVESVKQSKSHKRSSPSPPDVESPSSNAKDTICQTPPSSKTSMKNINAISSDRQMIRESLKQRTPSSSKMKPYELSDDKSPIKSKVSERNAVVKNANSKTLVISPIKTEDDEVLKNILQDISPLKPLSKASCSLPKLSSSKHQNLFASRKNTNNGLNGPIAKQKVEEVPQENPADGKNVALEASLSGTRSCVTESPLKRTPRKCSPTKSTSNAIVELRYPALNIKPKMLKPKPKEGTVSLCNISSPSKQPLHISSPCKETGIGNSPVRRSPRKHTALTIVPLDKKRVSENPVHLKTSPGKENKIDATAALRRSPRKHTSTAAVRTVQSVSSCEATCEEKVSKSATVQPQTSCDKFDEFDDAAFQEDYHDVLSYMANINEDELNTLDLHEAQLCEVVSIDIKIPYKEVILTVKSIENQSTASCRVCGCWLACPVQEGDSISLQAVKTNGEWLLDNTQGFLVLYPDTLISGTAVVGSLFCARRSVLSSMFRGLDSDSPVMVIGSIVHELFQMVLQCKKYTEAEVKQLSEQLISSKKCVQMLYGANMTMAQMQKELSNFIPRIIDFVQKNVDISKAGVKDKKSAWLGAPLSSVGNTASHKPRRDVGSNDWNGKIIGIQDIEETLWEPKLGIKGMVDVSVEVKDKDGNRKVMPLELKTGRASFSAEHQGQVTLYTMMMSKRAQTVNSGLLLYLREGQMREITVAHNQKKDLILLRNTLAHFLKPRVPVLNVESGEFVPPRLPEPIDFKSACEKCPYATLCSAYLMKDGLADISKDHPMVSISSSSTQHLTLTQINYVLFWVGLLLLEDSEQLRSSNLKYIWRATPEDREKSKQAIANLRLLKPGVENDGKYHHLFARRLPHTSPSDLNESGLNAGDYILISTDTRIAIERGIIIDINSTAVKVSTNRNLFDRYANETFHLDTSENNTVSVFNLTNLGCLLENNESADRLRKIVIDRTVPTFSAEIDKNVVKDCLPIFKKLDNNQRNALLQTLKADSHLLIKGLPGTGKTATMVALVELLVHSGLSVLVTSHTHSAVDNLLLRLKKAGLKFLRLGPDSRIHPQLLSYSESFLTKNCKSPEELDKVYNQQQIVGVTCLGAGHSCLSQHRIFDVCLVDESTQVLQPSILRPLFCARRFVLVGDPEQLPPVVKSYQAQELGLSESLFARLDSAGATVSLTLNYRMNQVITDLANGLTYEGQLKCGNKKVADATLKLTLKNKAHEEAWLSASLSTDIEKSVVFIDTSASDKKIREEYASATKTNEESSCANQFELALVMKLLSALVDNGVSTEDIGIMAPYRAQVSLLTQTIKATSKLSEIEVNTVDQFQGRDKNVIVYSCTRSDGAFHPQPKERGILNDKRRLTVAITRAKHKLILIGHCETLKLYAPFKKLLSCMSESNIVPVNS